MLKLQLTIKRLFDFLNALISMIFLFPIFCIIALLIKLDSEGPVFFMQERIGKGQKRFKVFKFRTMVDNAINLGTGIHTGKGDPRITKIGSFLRKTSIDELPQLINILFGEMSLIGPRPAIDLHLKQYSTEDYQRFNMKPGITGLAQINGRSKIPVKTRLIFDKNYVINYSLWLDLKIFIKSFIVVLRGENLYHREIK